MFEFSTSEVKKYLVKSRSSFSIMFNRRDSTGSINNSTGILHHQAKLDVFLIKGYQLVSHHETLHVNEICKSNRMDDNQLLKFTKLSQLYNVILMLISLDESSSSPKSPIELFQRFQQILKELQLSDNISPYSKYFDKVEENDVWKIKEDKELIHDFNWQLVSKTLSKIYDSTHDQILFNAADHVLKRKHRNTTNGLSFHFSTSSNGVQKNNGISSKQLETKLNDLNNNGTTDRNGQSLKGYYTIPTSPTSFMELNTVEKKNHSEANDEQVVQELLGLTANKKLKLSHANLNSNVVPIEMDESNQNRIHDLTNFDTLLREKDERILQLQKQLKEQSDEIIWLRKMLIEDLGCIRSMLKDGKQSDET